jgi:hypothetical protein
MKFEWELRRFTVYYGSRTRFCGFMLGKLRADVLDLEASQSSE